MPDCTIDDYDIFEHRHRVGIWTAGRAVARAASKCGGIDLEEVRRVIEHVELKRYVPDPQRLPDSTGIDAWHRDLRSGICDLLNSGGRRRKYLEHGFAAKVVNVYFKTTIVICGFETDPKVALLHPPIDSRLLEALKRNCVGEVRDAAAKAMATRWSNLKSVDYERVIDVIRKLMKGRPLWKVEALWQPSG